MMMPMWALVWCYKHFSVFVYLHILLEVFKRSRYTIFAFSIHICNKKILPYTWYVAQVHYCCYIVYKYGFKFRICIFYLKSLWVHLAHNIVVMSTNINGDKWTKTKKVNTNCFILLQYLSLITTTTTERRFFPSFSFALHLSRFCP